VAVLGRELGVRGVSLLGEDGPESGKVCAEVALGEAAGNVIADILLAED